MICLSFLGGSARSFARLARELPVGWEVVGAQPPGYDTCTLPALVDFGDFVRHYCDIVRRLDSRPCVLFGHSLGAVAAFAVAQRLEAEGQGPDLLVLSGAPPPDSACRLAAQLQSSPGPPSRGALATLGMVPDGVDDEAVSRLLLGRVQADLHALATIEVTSEAVRARTIILAAVDDQVAPRCDMEGWAAHLTQYSVVEVEGSHMFPVLEPARAARALQPALAQCRQASG